MGLNCAVHRELVHNFATVYPKHPSYSKQPAPHDVAHSQPVDHVAGFDNGYIVAR